MILKEGSAENALNYVRQIIIKLKKKELPLSKLIMQTQLKMNIDDYEQIGPHVAVAKKLRNKGIELNQGSLIWYVIKEGTGMIRDRAEVPEECNEKDYDAEYYINNQVIPAVEKIFEVFGYKKEDLIEKEQSQLGGFING